MIDMRLCRKIDPVIRNHALVVVMLLLVSALHETSAQVFVIPPQPEASKVPYYNNNVTIGPGKSSTSSSGQNNHSSTSSASAEAVRLYTDELIRQQQRKELHEKIIAEGSAELDATHIEYELPFKDAPEKNGYYRAFDYLHKVLDGVEPLNLEKAVFQTESAFDPSLQFNEFDALINKSVSVIGLKMQADRISPDDNVGKIMTAFRFMADTITVRAPKSESTITTYPKTYDFEDFWGRQDYRKMFVSKLLKEGTGQCHSLPLYFLILCEKMKAEASLAFAPNHSFIKFKDKRGAWHNMELTNGILASDHFMIESGYIKAEAIQSKIYLQPLTKKEVIVQCLNDLALGYTRKYGYDRFVHSCASLALDHDFNSLAAHQINANYQMTLDKYILYQYKTKHILQEAYDQDGKAKAIRESAIGANKFIEKLGFTEIPPNVYAAWLKSARSAAAKQQHNKEVKVLGGMIEVK